MSDHVKVRVAEGVMRITFARPEKKNALTNEMYRVWADALLAADADPAVRAILIDAEGDAFSAGNDLGDFARFGSGAAADEEMHVNRVLRALAASATPIVAAVNGLAVGVGTTLLLHCDVAYAAEDAKLTTPFVGLALVPEAASSVLLPAAVGSKRAYAMFALGEALTGREAEAAGLITKALPADQVVAAAEAAAARLAALPPAALRHTKRLMRDGAAIAAVMDKESALFAAQLRSEEAREAFAAFMERRAPDFSKIAAG